MIYLAKFSFTQLPEEEGDIGYDGDFVAAIDAPDVDSALDRLRSSILSNRADSFGGVPAVHPEALIETPEVPKDGLLLMFEERADCWKMSIKCDVVSDSSGSASTYSFSTGELLGSMGEQMIPPFLVFDEGAEQRARTRDRAPSDAPIEGLVGVVTSAGPIWDGVGTLGSGPHEEESFDGFLGLCGIEVFGSADPGVSNVVVGRHGWDEADLDQIVVAHQGQDLRVYSQELALHALREGFDPFGQWDRRRLIEAAGDHPALVYLIALGFDWPASRWTPGSSDRIAISFLSSGKPEVGVLSLVGYHVGANGLASSERHAILSRLFESLELAMGAGIDSEDYLAEWSVPMSPRRLQKMANTLKGLADYAKSRKAADVTQAIGDWESDCGWLKSTYFDADPLMSFRWPGR